MKLLRKNPENKILRLNSKAEKFAKFRDVEGYFTEPEICGYSSKGMRLIRRILRSN